MILSRLQRRLAALAAVLAMALQAFWPLIAQAQPRVRGELVPVCTVGGITHYVELPADRTPLEQRSDSHDEHCKLCVFGGAKAQVIRPLVVAFLFSAVSFARPEFGAQPAPDSRNPLFERSRAPPTIS